jgi:hypothetical protein
MPFNASGVRALDVRLGVALVGRCREDLGCALQQLRSPLADLVGMDPELLGKLIEAGEIAKRLEAVEGVLKLRKKPG